MFERNKVIAEKAGATFADLWMTEDFAGARAMFGDEYKEEYLRKYQEIVFFNEKLIQIEPNGTNKFRICNDDHKSNQGIKELN